MTTADLARAVVVRHALDADDAAELLDMLGLADGQQDVSVPRGCSGQSARRRGTVHALSVGTEARLAASTAATPAATAAPVARLTAPAAPRVSAATDRRCEGCGEPVVAQTRYRRDPAGFRARGVRLLAAKGRCHPCYNQLRRPAAPRGADLESASSAEVDTASPAPLAPAGDDGRHVEVERLRVERDELADALVVAERERIRLAGLLEEASARITEMQRQAEHVHTYPLPRRRGKPRPCACGHRWPGYRDGDR